MPKTYHHALHALVSATVIALFMGPPAARAQFFDRLMNPKVKVELQHPPEVGLSLETVAIGRVAGECSEALVAGIQTDLAGSLTIVQRQNIEALLGEIDFGASGYVDAERQAEFGRLYGASVMLSVDVLRCELQTERKYQDTRDGRRYFAFTTVFLKVSTTINDVQTGQILPGSVTDDYDTEAYLSSFEGYPDYPEENKILDTSYAKVRRAVRRKLLPWTEEMEVVFFNDGECRMKEAHSATEIGRYTSALEVTMAGLESCKTQPGLKRDKLARAYYNAGMGHLILGNYEEARRHFGESNAIKPSEIVAESDMVAETQINLKAARIRLAEEQKAEVERMAAAAEKERQELAARTITNDHIINMSNMGMPEALILKTIQDSPCDFDVTPDGMMSLTEAGVSTNIVMAMMDKR